ncbi:MAG: hypothetical protein JO189_05615 [Deltaproteobacteria bacterium]|nr:hypothetical protein [Deltaproteobacteria bacterium]
MAVATALQHVGFGLLLTLIAAYYLLLLSNGTFQVFAPEMLDKAFDNMLLHLLRGEFTVDRDAIGYEAFTRDGKTYAYFGIFPAILRVVALPFTNIGQAELARLSCLTAVVIFVGLQLRMLVIVHRSLPPASRRPEYLTVMVVATMLSGPQIYILSSALIYHEAVLWSAAMAAAFNLIIVRTTFGAKTMRGRDLVSLAVLAGLAINTRASIGVALYLGTTLLLAWAVWHRYASDRTARQVSARPARFSSAILPAIGVLGLAAAVAGFINFERWGNPFSFADFHYYDMRLDAYQTLFEVTRKYGEFGVGRIPIGALYYLTDLPYLLHTVQPFAGFLHARVVTIDGPPNSPIVTNPLTLILAGIGLYRVWWKPDLSTQSLPILRLALLGHAAAVVLVLGYFFFTMRYRFDFTPFTTLAAVIGFRSVSIRSAEAGQFWRRRVLIAAISLCLVGVVFSHYELIPNKVYGWVVPMDVRLRLLPFAPFAHYMFNR